MSCKATEAVKHDSRGLYNDHGKVVNASETRSAAIAKTSNGNYFLTVMSRGFLLNIDLNKGVLRQVVFPEGNAEYPYSSFCSSRGLVYTGAGKMLMEFEPSKNSFTYYKVLETEEQIVGFKFAESTDDCIYFSTYPSCRLFSYDPDTKAICDHGRMDDTQMYCSYMAVDKNGWVYLGIGTERSNIVAFNPGTYEKHQLENDPNIRVGSGYVHVGNDGKVYGHNELEHFYQTKAPFRWYSLFDGKMVPIAHDEVSPSHYYGTGFNAIHSPFIDASIIKDLDVAEHELTYIDLPTGKERSLDLKYESRGASLSPMVAGPDGKLYGTSNHPLHFYLYDPKISRLIDLGGKVIEKGGGGNICAFAVQGDIIAGAYYSGGHLHLYDTSRPIDTAPGKNRNPAIAAIHKEIYRPRCAVAHTDGQSIIYGGFAGYGETGGALCIFNIKSKQDILIRNEDILRYHSTLCMRVLKNGDIIAGTSVKTMGGACSKADDGEIYIMDWLTHKLIYNDVPIKGEQEISLMEIDQNQQVHCLTSKSIYFVFDPESKNIVWSVDLSEYGTIVRDGLIKGAEGKIYGILSRSIFTVDPERARVDILSVPPIEITAGMGMIDGVIYFGGGSHLWSYVLPPKR